MIDLFELDLEYERANNCMNTHGGVLTGAGIFPDSAFSCCAVATTLCRGATVAVISSSTSLLTDSSFGSAAVNGRSPSVHASRSDAAGKCTCSRDVTRVVSA